MKLPNLVLRIRNRSRRMMTERLVCRMVDLQPSFPVISFTFDDFPKTAWSIAGSILQQHEIKATYYAALGMMDQEMPAGKCCSEKDITQLLDSGHELGCHTFDHYDAWETAPNEFEQSMLRNREALKRRWPNALMPTMSYPVSGPRPGNKRKAADHYTACRGGGQTFNRGATDLNNLRAYFLEMCRGGMSEIEQLVRRNRDEKGWLIFATHDVCDTPSRYGCKPDFFEEVVRCSITSGARILPVGEAMKAMDLHV